MVILLSTKILEEKSFSELVLETIDKGYQKFIVFPGIDKDFDYEYTYETDGGKIVLYDYVVPILYCDLTYDLTYGVKLFGKFTSNRRNVRNYNKYTTPVNWNFLDESNNTRLSILSHYLYDYDNETEDFEEDYEFYPEYYDFLDKNLLEFREDRILWSYIDDVVVTAYKSSEEEIYIISSEDITRRKY